MFVLPLFVLDNALVSETIVGQQVKLPVHQQSVSI